MPEVAPSTTGTGFAGTDVLAALALARTGEVVDLDLGRFPGMPMWEGHPPFQLLTYRTPHGIQVQKDQQWLAPEVNDINFRITSEILIATCHSGTHIDALAHVTCGRDDHWYGGKSANEFLGDFGPTTDDASTIPPLIRRGVLIDVARHLGVTRLGRSHAIDASQIRSALDQQQVQLRAGDVVLVRTGQLSVWPDRTEMDRTKGSGIDISAANYLAEQGVVAVGVDTESCEVVPSGVPGNPHPVHHRLLIEGGIYIIENIYLEELSGRGASEFTFLALPLKMTGATASMIRPLAIL